MLRSVGLGPAGSAGRREPSAAPALSRRVVVSVRRTVVPWGKLAGPLERGRVVWVCGLGGQAGDLAGVALQAFEHGEHG